MATSQQRCAAWRQAEGRGLHRDGRGRHLGGRGQLRDGRGQQSLVAGQLEAAEARARLHNSRQKFQEVMVRKRLV
ncbi:hypothetical protein NHX12_013161 [Muraenolepis orangiensis]|uniref:Uncharacterized protein n=1 Tax=Muraenolepis orangiensis TaxID=630683 RepID=A0A9Q0I6L9_9TELE|nr:hypothetical protein NHX12_013161 [Muraenolepis orangiensis]